MSRAAPLIGVQGFRAGAAIDGVNANDPRIGSATMTRLMVLKHLRAETITTVDEYFAAHTNGLNNGGWQFVHNDFLNFVEWGVREGGATQNTNRITPAPPLDREDTGLLILCASYDGAVESRFYMRGTYSTTAVTEGGYTAAGAFELAIGARIGTMDLPASPWAVCALLMSDTLAMSQAQLIAAEAQLQADITNGRDLRGALTEADLVYYDARDIVGLTWPARVGPGVTLTLQNQRIRTSGYSGRF